MDVVILGLVLLVLLALLVAVWRFFLRRSVVVMPYVATGPLLSTQEMTFLALLQAVVVSNVAVLCKVRVVDVIKPRSGLKPSVWRSWFDLIVQKEFDFVLCNRSNFSVLAVIELDDSSRNNVERHKRNQFLKAACDIASVPALIVNAPASIVVEDLRRELTALIGEAIVAPAPAPAPAAGNGYVFGGGSTDSVCCPRCESALVLRKVKTGRLAGQAVRLCSRYPECRHIEAFATTAAVVPS